MFPLFPNLELIIISLDILRKLLGSLHPNSYLIDLVLKLTGQIDSFQTPENDASEQTSLHCFVFTVEMLLFL